MVGWHYFWCRTVEAAGTKIAGSTLLFSCVSTLLSLTIGSVNVSGRPFRAGGYAGQHPEKVRSMVLLAPAYNRAADAAAPALPRAGVAFNTQSKAEFVANWDRQVGCTDQFEPSVREAVWTDMVASDPVGATWGPGVRRAPSTTTWGWNAAMAAATMIPALIIAGVHDKQVTPDRVRPLYDDLGSSQKVLIDLGCASHNAMWEKNRLLMFKASLDWLTKGSVGETQSGIVRLGY